MSVELVDVVEVVEDVTGHDPLLPRDNSSIKFTPSAASMCHVLVVVVVVVVVVTGGAGSLHNPGLSEGASPGRAHPGSTGGSPRRVAAYISAATVSVLVDTVSVPLLLSDEELPECLDLDRLRDLRRAAGAGSVDEEGLSGCSCCCTGTTLSRTVSPG